MDRVIMESIDSLWFYSNVFCPRTTVSDLGAANSTLIEHVEEPVIEQVLKPVSPVVQNLNNESESEAGELIPVTPRCAEVAEAVEYYCPSPREKEQRRRRRSRSKRGPQRNRRKILGELELDLGVPVKAEVYGSNWILLEETWGYNNQFNLSDNMAMKEHLKTWAYAVACTVR